MLVTTSDFGIEEQHHPTTERVAAAEDVVSGIRRDSEDAGDTFLWRHNVAAEDRNSVAFTSADI